MKSSIKSGLSFGLTSGVITTLGLIIGLYSSTNSKLAILGGIFVIAIADALSDATGMHLATESKTKDKSQIWSSTASTFFAKLIIALTFAVPILTLEIQTAIIASIIWGFLLITTLSFYIAKSHKSKPLKAIAEHILIMIAVIIISFYVGKFVNIYF